jgi:two-component system chemotaxis response regulator CheB
VSGLFGQLSFRCRVGHAYSVPELVASKEAVLEARMWSAVFAFEEMDSMIAGLLRHALARDLGDDACRQRAVLAGRQAARLREVIQADRPLVPPHDEMSGAATTP